MKNMFTLTAALSDRLTAWSETARMAVILMELLWLSTWYDILVQSAAPDLLVELGLGGILLGSHILARWMNERKLRLLHRRLIFLGWVALVLLLSLYWMVYTGLNLSLTDLILRPVRAIGMLQEDLREFWHIMLILVLVWRGVALAREPVGILSAQFSFQLGLVMLLFSGIGMGFTKPLYAVLNLYAFLFFGLIAMSAARIHTVGDLRGGKLPLPGRRWMLGIILSAFIIVGVAVFAGWSSSTWAAEIVLQGYLFLFSIVIVIGLIVLSPVIALIFWFTPSLRELLSELFRGTMLSGVMEFLSGLAATTQNPPEWLVTGLQVGKPLLLGGVILLVVVGVLLLLAWSPWQARAQRELSSTDLPINPLIRLPRLILNQLGDRFRHSRRMIAAARIRWVYAQLMTLSAALGQARPQAATPVEFLPRLVNLFPQQPAELNCITQAYLKVRYGMIPETQAEVDEVNEAWERIRNVGGMQVREYKRRLKKGLEGR